jgi:hypothetical protein
VVLVGKAVIKPSTDLHMKCNYISTITVCEYNATATGQINKLNRLMVDMKSNVEDRSDRMNQQTVKFVSQNGPHTLNLLHILHKKSD